jgi:GNAT superfamily N-acetyltransferase
LDARKQPAGGIALRRTAAQDLDSVVALDAANSGRTRQVYFERRLQAALAQPALHLQFSAEQSGKLVGFMMARQLLGQFGLAEPALRLEAMGVAQGEQGHGIGSALLARLEAEAKRLGVPAIRTIASWRDHAVTRFLDGAGFEAAQSQIVDSVLQTGLLGAHEDDDAPARARMEVHTLQARDLDDIVRIDRQITGRRREAYIRELLDEALSDSAVRVSLVARVDGIAAGFVAARTDFGDFGRPEPVAVLDTIGVDPDYANLGVGHALLAQLFANLEGLRVERVETVVAPENFELLAFFYHAGFKPSQRLAFVKRLS